MKDTPKTLIQAVRYYSDIDRCNAKMVKVKRPKGVTCPKCGGKRVGQVTGRNKLKCNTRSCQKQFSYKVGTIFEDSPLGLDKWFVAVWCVANDKNGISSCELARALGVTQKTAWFMLHRIREAMKTGTFQKLSGTIEADETFVGGKAENMHKKRREKVITGRGPVNKTIVQGVLRRNQTEKPSEVRTFVVPNTDGETLRPNVARNAEWGMTVYTDATPSYTQLARRFVHSTIDHALEYVRGAVHVNGMENFWSLLKRALKGTYIHVAPFHLERYCDEQAFRFNHRKTDDTSRFDKVLSMVVGKRLTYRRLCMIEDCGFMGIR